MKQYFIPVALTAAALLLSTSLSFATDNNAESPHESASKPKASPKIDKTAIDARRKAAANIKLVNINGATRKQLKKLPGVNDAEADKIIAGRPYLSKADLVTHNIIARGVYENLKKLIIAKQPSKDAAKNAAIYSKKK